VDGLNYNIDRTTGEGTELPFPDGYLRILGILDRQVSEPTIGDISYDPTRGD
jgi:hypothetical protein